jgi:hypothetical protein
MTRFDREVIGSRVLGVPSGLPCGGWYALDTLTGANLGMTKYGEQPKRLRSENEAVKYGAGVMSKEWGEWLFRTAVSSVVLGHGGVHLGAEAEYEYVVATPAGPLKVLATDAWVECCFEERERAAELVRTGKLNAATGRWDWGALASSRAGRAAGFAMGMRVLMGWG